MKKELERAVKLVAKGATFGEAAKTVGITRSAVAGACFRAGVRGNGTPPTGDVTAKVIAMYRSGAPYREMALAIGWPPSSAPGISTLLRRAGVKPNRRPRQTTGARA